MYRNVYLLLVVAVFAPNAPADDPDLESLRQEFKQYSGAELVFHRDDLPPGRYHDVMKPLRETRKAAAAKICLEEVRLYPPGFLSEAGFQTVGVFATCASKTTTDPSRPFDARLGGYRYFGVYNGTDAIAASFYSEGQLALTFHHEIFHHVDSTVDGETAVWQLSGDDAFYQAAISGMRPYKAPPIAGEDLAELKRRCIGYTLKDAVSQYAAKNSREDQAETARHLMSMLPNSLVQAIERPELPGSQRILHVLREYEQSVADGPGFDWFVDVALDRARRDFKDKTPDQLIVQMRKYAVSGRTGFDGVDQDPSGARAALKSVVRVSPSDVDARQAAELVSLSKAITLALLRQRIRPNQNENAFDIWGQEDARGINHTLRHDVIRMGNDARRLQLIAAVHKSPRPVTRTQVMNLRLISRYYVYIKSNWSVSAETQKSFDEAKQTVLETLAAEDGSLYTKLQSKSLDEIAQQVSADGRL